MKNKVMWFCAGHGNVGIVQVTHYDSCVYYIGACSGANEEADIKHITEWGSKFPNSAGDKLFGVTE